MPSLGSRTLYLAIKCVFTRQVSITQVVDPAYGVEPIERSWCLNAELPIQVVIQPKREALQEAKRDRDGVVMGRSGCHLV